MKYTILLLILIINIHALQIIQKPIIFDKTRVDLTKKYIKNHYALEVKNIKIKPEIIVVHHTGIDDLKKSYNRFVNPILPNDRPDISKASRLNVSAHFLVDTDGTIYALMSETTMARHVIGLNYSSIGIENVGGHKFKDNLTDEQLKANIELVKYLKYKYPSIKHVIGHYEYKKFEKHELWREVNPFYRTVKNDPSVRFMKELIEKIEN